MNQFQRVEHLRRHLPELAELEDLARLARLSGGLVEVQVEAEIAHGDLVFPIHSYAFGAKTPGLPRVAIVGGVHGLERVGTNLAISFLKTLFELVQWDQGLRHVLDRCRLHVLPLLNPVGMFAKTRANGRGVDLMRNAPVEAEVKPNLLLVGGHRLSPRLPWYRGGAALEIEAETLCRFVRRELFGAPFALTMDLHSGFGLVDRLWFPFAYSKRPFDHLGLVYALKHRLDRSLPHHVYVLEPQSHQYVTHGDLWDYLFLEHRRLWPGHVLLPLTLEMGSWLWVKKNPRQAFSALGIFNPMIPHRLQRTLRRHLALLDVLLRLAASHERWAKEEAALVCEEQARQLWYAAPGGT